MSPDIENLFNELVDLSPEEREHYLAAHGVGDSERREVESLLAYDEGASRRLQASIAGMAEAALPPPPVRCGSYELKELIGQGGMGAVYRATRADGEVRQEAAVKLMHGGWTNPNLRGRFLRERQILAQLSHPNIAGLLDAGRTEDNRPYFVMELVEGRRIDEYCQDATLTQKIELFLKVCDAVSFAHSRLIVHRDLKPSNILVKPDGSPKLLDFGIAKILDDGPDSESTHTSDRVLTPAYASPEQVLGGVVTTHNDIYSLGAVLYKILTGHTPHDEGATPEEQFLSVISGTPRRLREYTREIPEDVEIVVMKALRREPTERYRTVDEFAEDLRAFLGSRPIQARQGELAYRVSKYVRHWRWTIAAVSAVIIALAAGLIATNRQREIADRRFQLVRNLSGKLFEIERQVRQLPGGTSVRQYIAESSLSYLDQLAKEASEPDLLIEIAEGYRTIANVMQRRSSASLGRDKDAAEALEKGYALLRKAGRPEDGDRRLLVAMARNREALVGIRSHADRKKLGDPVELVPETARLLDAVAEGSTNPEDLHLAAAGYRILNAAFLNSSRTEESRSYAERGLRYARTYAKLKGDDEGRMFLAIGLRNYGTFLRYDGHLESSRKALEEARAMFHAATSLPQREREISIVEYYLGTVCGEPNSLNLEDTKAAVQHFQNSLTLLRRFMREDPNDNDVRVDFAMGGVKLARILTNSDPQAALALFDEVYQTMYNAPKNAGRRKDYLTRAGAGSTYALRKLGRNAEAKARIQRVREEVWGGQDYAKTPFGPTGAQESLMRAEADQKESEGRLNDATALYRKMVECILKSDFQPRSDLTDGFNLSARIARLEELLRKTGQVAEADLLLGRRMELRAHWLKRRPAEPLIDKLFPPAKIESPAVHSSFRSRTF
ncbi:MAG: serine/threonine protein kinase [Bryobacterales bacterium]|nr:serine/threonine protein kinase [Bryobacterales bacterium]